MRAYRPEDESLFKSLYPQLREIARRLIRRERSGHTLQGTALVHEVFLKLANQRKKLDDIEPGEFLLIAAGAMRRMLIDHARKHRSQKRGGGLARVPLLESDLQLFRDTDSLLALDEALTSLGESDPRALQVVELKFFAGCTNAETAQALACSDGTVEAVWLYARLWLHRELTKATRTERFNAALP